MIFRSLRSKKNRGFTLLEVLIAFSLLATLLTVIIQSQAQTAFFLEKTGKLSRVQKEVINALLRSERYYSTEEVSTTEGVFPDDHQLAGDRWQKEVVLEDFSEMLPIPVTKITYRIIWNVGKNDREQYFESSILGEPR